MTTAQQVLDVARSQLGTVEARDGSTPYHRAYGLPFDQPWCAVLQWWIFHQAGAPELIHPRTAYTPTLAAWFKQRNQWTVATPTAGALVFYDWPDSLRRIQHVGIVESFDATTVTAIEGNTSSGTAGSQSNGGGVWRRRRARNSSIAGYGHPAYAAAAVPPQPSAPARDEVDMASIEELRTLIRAEVPGAVWQSAVPDYYPAIPDGQAPPTMPAWAALAWGTTHAAHARDEAGGAHTGVAELAKRIASGGASVVTGLSDDDLHRVAAAVLDEQARRLAG